MTTSDLAVELGGVEDDQQDYRVAASVEDYPEGGIIRRLSVVSVFWDHQARMAVLHLGNELYE